MIFRMLVVAVSMLCGHAALMAAFVIEFDPSQTQAGVSTQPQSVTVDFLIDFIDDGQPSTLSSYTVSIENPGPGLSLGNVAAGDLVFNSGPSLVTTGTSTLIGGFNSAGNVSVPEGPASILFRLDFELDADLAPQVFPINVSLVDASRDVFTGIESEFTVRSGTFEATAVPEPSSMLALLAVVSVGGRSWKRRRRPSTAESFDID